MDLKPEFNPKVFIPFFLLVWIVGFGSYSYVEITSIPKQNIQRAKEIGETTAKLVLLMRKWNAQKGGVYVEASPNTPPNPYLKIPDRDIQTQNKFLTKVNPSYMVKQLSELSYKQEKVKFKMLGTHPLNPDNLPKGKEKAWVNSLLKTKNPLFFLEKKEKQDFFYYLYPLKAEKECLTCHNKLDSEHQHQVGETLGALLINFPFQRLSIYPTLGMHILILLSGCFFICFLGQELKDSYTKIENQAYTDALTGIWNRRYFNQRILEEINRSKRHHYPLSLILIDIDFFKKYNDTYGHLQGDVILKTVASHILKELKRKEDLLCRFGGEEFIVLLPHVGLEGAQYLAEKIRQRIESLTIEHEKSPWERITISLGVTTYKGTSPEKFIEQADQALYQAKNKGRNRVEYL